MIAFFHSIEKLFNFKFVHITPPLSVTPESVKGENNLIWSVEKQWDVSQNLRCNFHIIFHLLHEALPILSKIKSFTLHLLLKSGEL